MEFSQATARQATGRSELVDYGIAHCRAGRWEKGFQFLGHVAERGDSGQPGLFFSYLGCAIARVEERTSEGLELCRAAVQKEFYQPENWANLAEVLLMAGNRREAADAIERGLSVDPDHPRLHDLQSGMGLRRRPVVRFLSRSNPVNRLLGSVRYHLRRPAPRS